MGACLPPLKLIWKTWLAPSRPGHPLGRVSREGGSHSYADPPAVIENARWRNWVEGDCPDGSLQSFSLLPILFLEGSAERQNEESIEWDIRLYKVTFGIYYVILFIY